MKSAGKWPEKLAAPVDALKLLEAIAADLTAHENSILKARAGISLVGMAIEVWKVGEMEARLTELERVVGEGIETRPRGLEKNQSTG